jgi:hypothetical protein
MDGKIKFVLLTITLVTVCITVLFSLLFIALWQYKVIVGISLLVILIAGTFSGCVVALRGNTHAQLPQQQYPPVLKQERIQSPYDQFHY